MHSEPDVPIDFYYKWQLNSQQKYWQPSGMFCFISNWTIFFFSSYESFTQILIKINNLNMILWGNDWIIIQHYYLFTRGFYYHVSQQILIILKNLMTDILQFWCRHTMKTYCNHFTLQNNYNHREFKIGSG